MLAMTRFLVREIQNCKLLVIFCRGGIISLCGGNLIVETAEVDAFSVYADSGAPFVLCFAPIDAFVSGT